MLFYGREYYTIANVTDQGEVILKKDPKDDSSFLIALVDVVALAEVQKRELHFRAATVTVRVAPHSNPILLARDWQRGMMGCLGNNPTVGPFPNYTLSFGEWRSDGTRVAAWQRKARMVW